VAGASDLAGGRQLDLDQVWGYIRRAGLSTWPVGAGAIFCRAVSLVAAVALKNIARAETPACRIGEGNGKSYSRIDHNLPG